MLIKVMWRGSFSLMVFGRAQIVMDMRPLVVMRAREGRLRGVSHTYLGAALLAVLAGAAGKHLSEAGLKSLQIADHEQASIGLAVVFLMLLLGLSAIPP